VAAPAALKPANNLSLSGWYRATQVDTAGGEILSQGDNYVLRIRAASAEVVKRTINSAGTGGTWITCSGAFANARDGAWHHLLGVISVTGMKLYVDGVEICTNTNNTNLRYDRGPDLFVGRHGQTQLTFDFDGEIDDVRIYARALSATDAAWLAQGKP
jgi:hypothetical protein